MSATSVQSTKTRAQRPIALTLLCILAFVTVPIAAISNGLRLAGHPMHLIVTVTGFLAVLAAFVGVWQMRRWGVWLYAAAVSINLVNLFVTGAPSWPYLAIPAALLAAFLVYYRRMQ